jgi:oligopeptide/dipeptide ABC transporter ATP-binding protein
MLAKIIKPDAGEILLDGKPAPTGRPRSYTAQVQMIFQDPFASLNPRLKVREIVGEAPRVHGLVPRRDLDRALDDTLRRVGLDPSYKTRYPHQFSGGQRQRIGIARALAVDPEFVVCDEPVAALDVSIQAQIINLFVRLREELDLAYLFISHDLGVVRRISDRVAVMYCGQIVEEGPTRRVYDEPTHPFTLALLSAIPVASASRDRSRQRIILTGDLPSPADPPAGCRFHTRCPFVMDVCRTVVPQPVDVPDGGTVRCHLHTEGPKLQGTSVSVLLSGKHGATPNSTAAPEGYGTSVARQAGN